MSFFLFSGSCCRCRLFSSFLRIVLLFVIFVAGFAVVIVVALVVCLLS